MEGTVVVWLTEDKLALCGLSQTGGVYGHPLRPPLLHTPAGGDREELGKGGSRRVPTVVRVHGECECIIGSTWPAPLLYRGV